MTFSEFLEWVWFLEWEETKLRGKTDFYLAQIAAEIRRSNVRHPKRVRVEDFLLRFQTKDEKDRLASSKAAWLLSLGLKPKNEREKA